MQHGTTQEAVLDILENAIAVLDREKRLHGRPIGDVIEALRAAEGLVQTMAPAGFRSPFDTLREDPFEAPR